MNRLSAALQGSYDNAYAIAKAALPVVLPLVGMYDSRIGNILNGALFVGSGSLLISHADIPSMVRASESAAQESTSNKMMRLGMATFGLVMVGAGACNLYNGFSELISPAMDLKLNATPAVAKPMEPSKAVDPLASCKEKLAEGKKLYLSCPEAKKVWNEVKEEGPFTLECLPREKQFAPGATDPFERKIFFTENHYDGEESSMKDTLAFEMMNLKNHKSFQALDRKICLMSANEYAKQTELVEYQSYRSTMFITNRCLKGGFWPSWPSTLPREFLNSSEFLRRHESSGHTNFYRLEWVARCAKEQLGDFLQYLFALNKEYGIELPSNYYGIFKDYRQL